MELGPQAYDKLCHDMLVEKKILKDIEDLFLTKQFIPFTFIPKEFQLDLNSDLPAHIRKQFRKNILPSKMNFEKLGT